MSIALDIGSHRIQSLRKEGAQLIGTNLRCAYSVLPDSATHRHLLEHGQLQYVACDEGLLLIGDAAEQNSSLFKSTSRTLLPDGRIPKNDPLARQVIASLIETACPASGWSVESKTPAPNCCFTVPGGIDMEGQGRSDLEFFLRCIRLQGYEPRIVPSAAALVLAELVQESFTGIGMVFGDSGCEAMLAHRGKPICHARTEFGGQWINDRLAERQKPIKYNLNGESFLNVAEMAERKHSMPGSIAAPLDSFEETLADLMTQSCVSLIEAFSQEITASPQATAIPQPLSVVCIGGTTRTAGFHALITEVLEHISVGVAVKPPRIINESDYTIARGLLIDAELNSPAIETARAA
jgi:hypothetical protein